ncbi:MAG: hypothetical protein JWM18_424 [Chloroflexi bacterium]|jgi:hypothetical protein|nr:hypothetical protein [Chloroflexota bacterium]
MDQNLVVDNIVRVARTDAGHELPIVLSTLAVATGRTCSRSRGCRPSIAGCDQPGA